MKRSKKITIFVIIFFLVIALVIVGRYAMGLYFKSKFGKRSPPGVIVKIVEIKNFNQNFFKTNQDQFPPRMNALNVLWKVIKCDKIENILVRLLI